MNPFTKWLIDNDFIAAAEEESQLSDKAKAKLKAQFDAEQKPADPTPSPHGTSFLETLEAERKEKDRIDAINSHAEAAVKRNPTQIELIEKMVKAAHGDKTVEPLRFELELFKAMSGPGASNVPRGRDSEAGGRVLEAAICKSLGLQNIDKQYDAQTLEASDKYFRHGIGLQQLLFKAAAANGEHFDGVGNLEALLRAAFGRSHIQAQGWSAVSLPGILSNVMNKLLLDHFNFVEATWRQISAVRPVRDFKQISSYSLTGDLQYEKIGPAGEIKHGTLGEATYTNKAETYAKMLAITRTDIINDDLGAIGQAPQKLGRGGALKINDVFWTVFLNNASFFASGNSNVSTGGGSALGTADGAAINAAEVIFAKQTDPDGKPLGAMLRLMLVPPTLFNTGSRWMGGQLLINGGTNTTIPDVNVYQGRYRVLTSVYMENTTYTGNSNAAWYLLCDPRDLPVIETVFLNGRDTPVVESADADFNTLGIQVRAYHDFGVALQEPRGGVRSAGS